MAKGNTSVLDADTVAQIRRRLTKQQPQQWAWIQAECKRLGQSWRVFLNWWHGPTGNGMGYLAASPLFGGPSEQGEAWRAAQDILFAIQREHDDAEVDSYDDLHNAIEAPDAPFTLDPPEPQIPVARVTVRLKRPDAPKPSAAADDLSTLSYAEAAKLIDQGIKDKTYADDKEGIRALLHRLQYKATPESKERRLRDVYRSGYT